jgi:hypothetical protein
MPPSVPVFVVRFGGTTNHLQSYTYRTGFTVCPGNMDNLAPPPLGPFFLELAMTDEEIKARDSLLDQLEAAGPDGVYVTPENLVATAHLVAQDQAEAIRDGFGYVRIRSAGPTAGPLDDLAG